MPMRLRSASLLLTLPVVAFLAACGRQSSEDTSPLNAEIVAHEDTALPNQTDDGLSSASSVPGSGGGAASTTDVTITRPGAIPAGFTGRWTGIDVRCDDRGSDMRLAITPGKLRFYESVGTITSVKSTGDRGIVVAAAYQGEGQSWKRSQKLTLSADGTLLTILADGTAITRKRCP